MSLVVVLLTRRQAKACPQPESEEFSMLNRAEMPFYGTAVRQRFPFYMREVGRNKVCAGFPVRARLNRTGCQRRRHHHKCDLRTRHNRK